MKFNKFSFIYLIIFLFLIYFALAAPLIYWDTLAYHFPFAVKLLHLAGYQDFELYSSIYGDRIQNVFDGFPLLPFYLQGFLYLMGGNLRYLVLISVVPYICFLLFAKTSLKLNLFLLMTMTLSVPLISIHIHSTYVDILSGSLVALLGITAAFLMDRQLKKEDKKKAIIAFLLLSLLCGQVKYFALPFIYLYSFLIACSEYRDKRERKSKENFFLFIPAFAILLGSLKIFYNFYQYKNPCYPISFFFFSGPEPVDNSVIGYFDMFGPLRRPLYFFTSVTEMDFLIRGVKWEYELGQGFGDTPLRFGPARTGGFGFLTMIFIISGITYFYKKKFFNDRKLRNLIIIFLTSFVINSFLPQSHELRYWLYLPMLGATIMAYGYAFIPDLRVKGFLVIVATLILYIQYGKVNRHQKLINFKWQPDFGLPTVKFNKDEKVKLVCTGKEVSFPVLFSTVLQKGEWRLNIKELCSNTTTNICTALVESNDGRFVLRNCE